MILVWNKEFKVYPGTRGMEYCMVLKQNSGRIILNKQIHLTKTLPRYHDSPIFIGR